MNQLKLVWELEKYNSIIDDCNVCLNELENSIRVQTMIRRINELESDINLVKDKISDNRKLTLKLERSLKEYDYTKRKLEKDLYSGRVTDVKQLEQLTVDRERTFQLIDEIESRILNLIDDHEILEERYIRIKDDYEQLRVEIIKVQREVNEKIKNLRIKMKDAELGIDDITPHIEIKILKRYDLTREKRGRGVVSVNNDVCGGCNMRIPTYLMQDIKKQSEIIYCESCGRLLYYIGN